MPPALPPVPPIDLIELVELLDWATAAFGHLDGVTTVLPAPPLFIYMYVQKQVVLSSQIEGTQSSLSDLLLFESRADRRCRGSVTCPPLITPCAVRAWIISLCPCG